MFNSVALDVVIGLVFVYLLYSLLGTLMQEIIATNVGLRGYVLKMAIKRMLDDDSQQKASNDMSECFYAHPLIKYLSAGNISMFMNKQPAYINNETFSKVIIDLLRGPVTVSDTSRPIIQNALDTGVFTTPDGKSKVLIKGDTLIYFKSMWVDAQGDVQKFRALLEQWFDEMMDRTTGWYKKYTQYILLGVGLSIALAFNVDTIKIVQKLQRDPKLREQLITQADAFTKAHPDMEASLQKSKREVEQIHFYPNATADSLKKDSIKKQMDSAYIAGKKLSDSLYAQASQLVVNDINNINKSLALGWDGGFCKNYDGLLSVLGWLLTALAISLGAPFWFDLLNKIMQLRGSVPGNNNGKSKADKDDSAKAIQRVG